MADVTIPKLRKTIAGDPIYAKVAEYDSEGNKISDSLAGKVDIVEGKGLSTEDYTTAEQEKLSGIASGAQVNVIEIVKVNNSALTPSNKTVNIAVPVVGTTSMTELPLPTPND